MAKKSVLPSTEFYEDNANLKWIILAVSTVISIGSIYYTNILVDQLKEREKNQMKLYARALEYTYQSNEDILFVTEEIVKKNTSIPTILMNEKGEFNYSNNIDIDPSWSEKKKNEVLKQEVNEMKKAFPPIEIILKDPNTGEVFGKQYVYYENDDEISLLDNQ